MTTVLAAIDAGPTGPAVLHVAAGLAELTGRAALAVHVREGDTGAAEAAATAAGIPLRVLDGPVEATLLRAVDDPTVGLAVFGARAVPEGARPVGHVALLALEHAAKAVVIVPPNGAGTFFEPPVRVLVPLEATTESSEAVQSWINVFCGVGAEIVALHVVTPRSAPRMLDHPEWDLPQWSDEFIEHFCPAAARIDLRTGEPHRRVAEASRDEPVDLVVLSWSQDTSAGHAAVVRAVLSRSTTPVLLVPVDGRRQVLDLTADRPATVR
jgi:hypothetical protein